MLANFMVRILKALILAVSAFLVVSCGDMAGPASVAEVEVGTVFVIQSNGRTYTSQAMDAKENYSVWRFSWGEQIIASVKYYMGLMVVRAEEGGQNQYNDFNEKQLSSLFPLKTGNTAIVNGYHHSERSPDAEAMLVTFIVSGEDTLTIGEDTERVFIIDAAVQIGSADTGYTITQRMWYSPRYGMSLKKVYSRNGETSRYEVIAINPSGNNGPENRPNNNLGTTLI